MKKVLFAMLIFLCLSASGVLAQGWPMFHHDAQHTGAPIHPRLRTTSSLGATMALEVSPRRSSWSSKFLLALKTAISTL